MGHYSGATCQTLPWQRIATSWLGGSRSRKNTVNISHVHFTYQSYKLHRQEWVQSSLLGFYKQFKM